MLTRPRFAFAATLVACLAAVSAYAQDIAAPESVAAPAHLAFVEGVVDVVHDGVTEAADPPVLLLEGDIVRSRNGRAELVFGDGTLLHLSHDSEMGILGEERLRLLAGRVIVRLSHAAGQPYVFDTPGASVRLDSEGEYEISATRAGRLDVSVGRGSARLDDVQQWSIRGGQMITVLGPGGRPVIASYNSARLDNFSSWSHDRANGVATSAAAAQLPYELRPYAPVLDRHGRWDYVEPHGYVWFPSVEMSWRPYYDGSWSFTRYGWTWHGRDRWAWPTHHYGRWGYNGAFWYWIPATGWAPAWVSWSVGSGYVSWAPLGWHSSNIYNRWDRRDHPAYSNYNPWRGWTVLPRQHFGPRRSVRAHAVDGERLDDVTRRVLLSRATTARGTEDIAVPRGSIRQPGARGNVRRPPPARTPDRAADAAPRVNDRRARTTDAPTYAPPPSWSGTAERVGGRGAERRAPKDPNAGGTSGDDGASRGAVPRSGSTRRGDAGRTDEGGGNARPRGGVRNPEGRSEPRSAPKSEAPSARAPQSRGGAGGAAAAVPRSGTARPKG
jgi:hypothetical protein